MFVNQKKLNVVSLFSGAGGLDLGLVQAGLDIVWALDHDKDCVETYKQNISSHIVCDDISNIKSNQIPDCDIVIGGFPCQGFSMANRFRSVDDVRNKLYTEMLRVIRDKNPKWFVAENVRGILSLGGGKVFEKILRDFNNAGYNVVYQVVNMADYGVPQMRRRVVILGTRKDLPEEMKLTHPLPTHSKERSPFLSKWVSMSEALNQLKKFKGRVPNNVGSKYKLEFRNFIGHRKTDENLPSPTILARGNAKGGVCAIPHPNGKRRLTVRESALIQTFPINFEFSGAINSMYRQIGNAVPVLYGKRLGDVFVELFRKTNKQKIEQLKIKAYA